jgi:hypothetical protein
MSLCVAWLREVDGIQELVFATDSCLSAGERWHSGVKLFELPRKDCLISFAGDTKRTYTLILNLISSIKFDEYLSSPSTDITEILEYLTNLFTNLSNSITNYGTQSFDNAVGDFEFLFGGWSWKENKFKLWKLEYKHDLHAVGHDEVTGDTKLFSFIGDEIETAEDLLREEIRQIGREFSREFDMEPFNVLVRMIRKEEFDYIDGAVQIAKIYPPGNTEFFGVIWPAENGKKTFLGKDVTYQNNPKVRYLDPDTGTILGNTLPEKMENILEELFGVNTSFIEDCYSGKNSILKERISSRELVMLKQIFEELAYQNFLKENEDVEIIEGAVDE